MAMFPRFVDLPSWGPGRTFLVGGTAVAAGLGAFYLGMHFHKRIQVERGKNPHYEHIISRGARASRIPATDEILPSLNARYGDIPPAFPGKDHHSGHSTLSNYKQGPDYAESGDALRTMVPPPQRAKSDGSGKPYTKCPDYADNYGKTVRPGPLSKDPTA